MQQQTSCGVRNETPINCRWLSSYAVALRPRRMNLCCISMAVVCELPRPQMAICRAANILSAARSISSARRDENVSWMVLIVL